MKEHVYVCRGNVMFSCSFDFIIVKPQMLMHTLQLMQTNQLVLYFISQLEKRDKGLDKKYN